MKILFLVTSVLFIGSTCNNKEVDCHNTISFINKSDKAIYVLCDTHYPDTLYFGHYSGLTSNAYKNKILANTKGDRPLQNRDCWETDFYYEDIIPSDTLMVYVFDAEVLESVSWSEVVENYMVLKRYDLSLYDLQHMNWTITYP